MNTRILAPFALLAACSTEPSVDAMATLYTDDGSAVGRVTLASVNGGTYVRTSLDDLKTVGNYVIRVYEDVRCEDPVDERFISAHPSASAFGLDEGELGRILVAGAGSAEGAFFRRGVEAGTDVPVDENDVVGRAVGLHVGDADDAVACGIFLAQG
jgi:Cu/Zn superoxide dismutase